jgi:hypothetical protein
MVTWGLLDAVVTVCLYSYLWCNEAEILLIVGTDCGNMHKSGRIINVSE